MRVAAYLLLLLLLSPTGSGAATQETLADPDKASAIIREHVVRLRLTGRGRAQRTEHLRVELRDQAAVNSFGQLVLHYLPEHERVTLRRLAILKPDGRSVDLTSLKIDDLTNPPGGLDPDARAKHVAVPGLAPGDILEYEAQLATTKPIVDGHYWTEHTFPRATVVDHMRFEVRAPVDLPVLVKARPGLEPAGTVGTDGDERVWTWESANPKPVLDQLTRPGALEAVLRQPPDIVVSTLTTWDALGRWFGELNTRRAEVTDPIRRQAAALTSGLRSRREQYAALAAFVGEKVRYVFLPLGARRYEPRPAADVLSSLFGDCKDKHVLLAALAAAIGIDVRPALIHSTRDLLADAPYVGQFDHVVSVTTLPGEGEVWSDTTAAVYPAGVLPPHLRGRGGLIIRADDGASATAARVVTTPEHTGLVNESILDYSGTLAPSGQISGIVVQSFTGDPAFALRLAVRQAGVQVFETISQQLASAGGAETLTPVAGSYEVQGVDAPAASVRVTYRGTRQIKADSMRQAWTFRPLADPVRFEQVRAREGDPPRSNPITLGSPARVLIRGRYDVPDGVTATAPAGVSVSNEVAEYVSRYRVDGRTLYVDREVTTKAFRVLPEQFPVFEAFLKAVEEDGKRTFKMSALPNWLSTTLQSADDYNEAGRDALRAREYVQAEKLFRKAIELDARHKWAWNNLGQALRYQGRRGEALEAYRKQITIVPADEYAHGNLGTALLEQGQPVEAEAAIRKHLEVKPTEEFGWRKLGEILVRQNRLPDAADAFEKAAGAEKAGTRSFFALARVRMLLGQTDRALDAIDRAVTANPGALAYGGAASELAFFGTAASRVQRYADRAFELASKQLGQVALTDSPEQWLPPTVAMSLASLALGQLEYARGDAGSALPWLLASWRMYETHDAGFLLAKMHGGEDRERDTIALLARAAELGGEGSPASLHLATLVPDRDERARRLGEVRADAERSRRLRLALSGTGRARVVVSVGADGTIDEVRFVSGDEAMRATAQGLVSRALDLGAPPSRRVRLIRQAEVSCAGGPECELVLDPVVPPGVDVWALR